MKPSSLRLWQLISPSLPVGAFSHSAGMETAVNLRWLNDEKDVQDWILGILSTGITCVDLPIIARCMDAWSTRNPVDLQKWNQLCIASRDTAELRDEERQMGRALQRLGEKLDEPLPGLKDPGFCALYAVMASNWQIESRDALTGYAWAWCENQMLVSRRLLRLGQSDGQATMMVLGERLEDTVTKALELRESDIGLTAPGQVMASMLHESQYSRQFRS